MRILFCTPTPLSKALGGPKVVIELAEGMRQLGWDCELRGRFDLSDTPEKTAISDKDYAHNLHRFLQAHAGEYDVVDYDHNYLPYPRADFAQQTLFVARSVLLAHHFNVISIPRGRGRKSSIRHLFCGRRERRERQSRISRAHRTIQEADLVNVCNEDDKTELIRCGISSDKIVVIPFGISQSRRPLFDAVSSAVPAKPVIAFVGSFDYRKGAREFPAIVRIIAEAVPEARFRLLGTVGMFQTGVEVLAHFPAVLRQKIDITPKFDPEELPSLLAPCSVGIFPSYIEGFGFGVLEMLAASIPVFAYDAPGPPMMLPSEYLVPRGDTKAIATKVAVLLTDAAKLSTARRWAQEQSQRFTWENSAKRTNNIYSEHFMNQRGSIPSVDLA